MSISTEQYTLEFRDEAIQQKRVKPYLRVIIPKVPGSNPGPATKLIKGLAEMATPFFFKVFQKVFR